MVRLVAANVAFNGLLLALAIALDDRALRDRLEETFVALTLLFGLVGLAGNAAFVALAVREGRRSAPRRPR